MKKIQTGRTTEVRVDVDSATREALVEEIERLAEVCKRWADSFQEVCQGNLQGWAWQVEEKNERIELLEKVIEIQNRQIKSLENE